MGFWGDTFKKIASSATGGIYSPKSKSPKMPKEQKYSMQKVGSKKQAGGAQISFTEEKMLPEVAKKKEKQPKATGTRSAAASQLLNSSQGLPK